MVPDPSDALVFIGATGDLCEYQAGTWRPVEAGRFIDRPGGWHALDSTDPAEIRAAGARIVPSQPAGFDRPVPSFINTVESKETDEQRKA